MFYKHASVSLLSLLVLTVFVACSGSPLTKIQRKSISNILVSDDKGRSIKLDSNEDIQFVCGNIQHLKANSDIKVSTDFKLTFHFSNNDTLTMRLGPNVIGPDVPGSQYSKRWYFRDLTLYNFVKSKFSNPNL